jgi:L-ascorbate metabolism protein UlaG (beta-lactamase superfamily)
MKITWLGHSAFMLEDSDKVVLIDPFITNNPAFPKDKADSIREIYCLLLTHMHFDHFGDTLKLSAKSQRVVGIYEVISYLQSRTEGNFEQMNIGGNISVGDLVIHMVPAVHSSGLVDNGTMIYGGNPCGYVLEFGGHRVYHAGDTALFLDMQLIQRMYSPDVCLLPIGDRFTMGPSAAAIACNEFLEPQTIIPMHFDTFPALTGKAEEFRKLVKRGNVVVLEPGKSTGL